MIWRFFLDKVGRGLGSRTLREFVKNYADAPEDEAEEKLMLELRALNESLDEGSTKRLAIEQKLAEIKTRREAEQMRIKKEMQAVEDRTIRANFARQTEGADLL